jgi:transposase
VIGVEDWAEIRRLHRAEGLPIKQIARIRNVSRNTVRAALRSDGPPRYEREPRGSVADGFEPQIRELLMAYPAMPASVIGGRIGWPYSDRTLRTRVAELRPAYLPPGPASHTSYAAGELAQDDFWFPDITLPVGFGQVRTAKQLPVLTLVSGYSRWAGAVLIPSRNAEDLYAGWWQLIQGLGAVPRLLVWDGGGAVGRHPDRLTAECQAFRGTLAARVYVCQPAQLFCYRTSRCFQALQLIDQRPHRARLLAPARNSKRQQAPAAGQPSALLVSHFLQTSRTHSNSRGATLPLLSLRLGCSHVSAAPTTWAGRRRGAR